MEQNIKISIVMPVYNTPENYLTASVMSVKNQSYSNFELIIVDDGSKSDCASLCDAISHSDSRIVIMHQNNSGVSSARNNGTQAATGNYVMYVDSDDYLAPYALEEGVCIAQKTGAEFVFAAIQHIRTIDEFKGVEGNAGLQYILYANNQIDEVRHSFFTQRNPKYNNVEGIGFVNRGPYARLVNTEIANAVRFNENLKLGEDVEWNMRLLNACSFVAYIPSIWYGYLIYENSSLRKYYGNRAQLLAMYHNELYSNNREYCDKHPDDFAMNLAVSFYSMAQFEYLSPDSPLSGTETNKEIKSLLHEEPWNILSEKARSSHLPVRYKIFLRMCRYGMGATFLKLWEGITTWKKKLR